MGRPKKNKVDYFPHDVNHSKTIHILKSKFGNDGKAFWWTMLELLGDSEGHYYDCRNDFDWEYLLSETLLDEVSATEILNTLVKLEAIDRELWDKKIIWCQKFMDRIADVYVKRGAEIPSRPMFLLQKVHENDVSVTESTQSKVKESKVNNKKIYTSENFISFYDNYPKHVEKKEALKQWILLNNRKDVPIPGDLNKIVNKQIECGILSMEDKCKFCMSPRRWLFGDRWQDEIIRKKEYTGKKYTCKKCGILKENEIFLNQPDMVMNNEPFYTCNFCSGKATET